MGTPDFAVPALRAVADRHEVVCVYTQPPRPAGRGHRERPSPVHAAAQAMGLPIRHPVSLRTDEARAAFAALGADVAVVAAYGLILPSGVLAAPRLGCINIHASLLPRWRGAAPIQRAIMAGDAETGITIMRMDEGLDTGPMLLKGVLPIGADMTAGVVHDRLAELGAPMVVKALEGLADGSLSETPQTEDQATYASKIGKADSRLDWSRPAAELACLVRGLSPFPGARFDHQGSTVKVLAATAEEGAADAAEPGTVLDTVPRVACGGGSALRLERLQRAGKGAMDADAFLRGLALPPGTVLG